MNSGCPIPQNAPFLPILHPTVKKTRTIFALIYSQITAKPSSTHTLGSGTGVRNRNSLRQITTHADGKKQTALAFGAGQRLSRAIPNDSCRRLYRGKPTPICRIPFAKRSAVNFDRKRAPYTQLLMPTKSKGQMPIGTMDEPMPTASERPSSVCEKPYWVHELSTVGTSRHVKSCFRRQQRSGTARNAVACTVWLAIRFERLMESDCAMRHMPVER